MTKEEREEYIKVTTAEIEKRPFVQELNDLVGDLKAVQENDDAIEQVMNLNRKLSACYVFMRVIEKSPESMIAISNILSVIVGVSFTNTMDILEFLYKDENISDIDIINLTKAQAKMPQMIKSIKEMSIKVDGGEQ